MAINGERLWQNLEALSTITDPDQPWTRRAFTDRYQEGRDWLKCAMQSAGLATRLDDAGNLIGTLPGSEPALAPLVLGSHIDTVPSGGRYDGILGVLAGLEAVQSLAESRIQLRHDVEVIDFLSEEPSEYGISCVGSRGMVGDLSHEMLNLCEPGGERLGDAIRRMGGTPEALSAPLRKQGDIAAFLELHIEQGRVLEENHVPIGVVSDIVGIHRYDIVVSGQADHAGTTPMELRRDALAEAAGLIKAIQQSALDQSTGDNYLVATVGRLNVFPNATNAIPERVEMVLEVRSNDSHLLQSFFHPILDQAKRDASTLGIEIVATPLSEGLPTPCAELIQSKVWEAAQTTGLKAMSLTSGAGHDAVYMAKIAPTGMLFVPCHEGRSHCPEESITPQQATNGCQVIQEALKSLDNDLG
ncbi:Zn-dependent hydrolase [Halomonas alkaliantarctica]|uniref:Zn-dependent hydrolase n=1 Tax=Halomonas alkaliantarctica TaxID=232346 RepID=A0ABY8LP58_9GAMM|nr:Zn-dependent hydrolase [Halomonas alkaliantarctica]WGI25179.1 Zn-dependent hydrolase [Halomonas alkaliantarctica]